MGGGNPSHESLRARMWPSPALNEIHPAKHHAVPAREGSSGREDEGVLDGGGERNERIQTNHTRQATKHGPSASNGARWVFAPPCWGNQSAPICISESEHMPAILT